MRSFSDPVPSLNGKSILITGGTGSFGQCFVATIIKRFKPKKVIIFSRDELKQFEMQQVFSQQKYPYIRYFIGDVRDSDRLAMAMRDVDIVIHAAALKQVPIAEYNPFECIRTNVHGAENIVNAAIRSNVKKVIALSTDKAAAPINLYGASKLAAEKIFVAGNNLSGEIGVRFSVVRYGNVVGSRGSVIPFFKKLLEKNVSSLPITDRRMTRFWITLPQGVDFVLSCLAQMQGGEVFVPKIPSMRVEAIAQAIAPHLAIHEIGIRPGEKLHEVMVTQDEARVTLECHDRYIIEPTYAFWSHKKTNQSDTKPVPENFSYTSDNNTEWLNLNDLRDILKSPSNLGAS